ncbi:hypothetical protein PUMCH_003679 [Australozyma saopauloensis]|uniref:Uncharacterized protein n=1 Tax=Australozyma saopauloensis TaxID=291208 RepID=A0AAX4HCQ6_9ASCO|nr:hypothetical protein PUMCH_003679 [[Candida] saopauloensis]
MQQTSRGTPNEHEAQFQGIFAGRDASGASAGSDSAPENTDGVAQQRVNDLEEGLKRVQVNIHGQLIVMTFMFIQVFWDNYLIKAKGALTERHDYERFKEVIEPFRSVVFSGFQLLVTLDKNTMSTIRSMALGPFIPSAEYTADLLQHYQDLRYKINSFALTVFPANPWGRQASGLRDEVIRIFNEDAQLIVYYYSHMMPCFWDMAIERLKFSLGFAHAKMDIFLGLLGTLAWLFGSIPSVSVLEMATETTAFFANMAVVYLDPLFKNHKSLPWKYWASANKVSVGFSSCLSILLFIYLVVRIFKPSLIQDLRTSYSLERGQAFRKWTRIRASLDGVWPKDFSKEDFTPVHSSAIEIKGNLESAYNALAARVEVTTCWVEVPADEILSDYPSTLRNQAPPRPPTQTHTR